MSLQTQIDSAQSPDKNRIADFHKVLRARIAAAKAEPEEPIRAGILAVLGTEFMRAAARGNPGTIQVFVDAGMDVNVQDSATGQTPLHVAAASQARDACRVLIASGHCDFLLRDKQGRLTSEMAYLYGRDPALARLLGIKERKQAAAQGISLTRRP